MYIRKIKIIYILIFFISFLFFNCSKDTTGPSDGGGPQIGWAVGGVDDGYGLILHTTDGGDTWTRQGDSTAMANIEFGGVFALDSLTAWVVGGGFQSGAIFKTTDGGNTWIDQTQKGKIDVELFDIDALDINTAWVVGGEGKTFYTTDAGGTWTVKETGVDSALLVSVVAFDAQNIWICGGSSVGHAWGVILRSTDGGDSWTSQGDTALLNLYTIIAISAVNQNCAWAVGSGNTIIHTTDGGFNWVVQITESQTPADANGVCALNENRAWVVMDHDRIFLTEDGGQSWTQQPCPVTGYYILRVCALNKNLAWATGHEFSYPFGGCIIHTKDGGQSWQTQGIFDAGISGISFVNAYR